jgi:hypothetical protein
VELFSNWNSLIEELPLECWSLFQFVEEEDVLSLYSIQFLSLLLTPSQFVSTFSLQVLSHFAT